MLLSLEIKGEPPLNYKDEMTESMHLSSFNILFFQFQN